MLKKENMGDRMKHFESCFDFKFIRSLPMIVRLDGIAFHSWTKKSGCAKPFDHQMIQLQCHRQKCRNAQNHHHRKDPVVLGRISPKPHILLFFPSLCHMSPSNLLVKMTSNCRAMPLGAIIMRWCARKYVCLSLD